MASPSHQRKCWVGFSLPRSIWPLFIKLINHKNYICKLTKKHNYITIKIHSLLVIHPMILRFDMTKDLSISKSAEECSYRSTKKANMLKAKRLIDHIYALSTCLTLTHTFTHIDKHAHTHVHWLIHSHKHTHTHTQAHKDMCKNREYVLLRNFWSSMER